MRLALIGAELAAAGALLAAVVLVAPGESARAYALATIVASVLPGLMLTGDVKMLNAGVPRGSARLVAKGVVAAAINLPLVASALLVAEVDARWPWLAAFVALSALGASAQAFSSVWFYVQSDPRRMLRSKLASLATRLAFAAAGVASDELMLAWMGVTLGTMLEFALNYRALPRPEGDAAWHRGAVTPLGAAYGLSRVAGAAIKLAMAQPLGALIASLLVIEQLVGGANSTFEKYFLRSTRGRDLLRWAKAGYLALLLALLPMLVAAPPRQHDRYALVWLALMAGAALLPLAEMYAALQRRGERFVAVGSAVVSVTALAAMGAGWLAQQTSAVALAAYVLLPGLTFVFYWLSSIHVRHHVQ